MQNSAVVPSQSDPSFAQQGTVDWTQLARSTVTLSLEVLSRLNQAGVETFTLAVGQAVFSPFLIPPESQRKIQSVLSDLKPFSSYGNILWFGFGIKHVVRLLVESEEGIACVALCGGLAVSYDKFYCAQVLRCLTEHQSAPSHLKPSILQWSNLINVCSGSLATSDFSNIVEGLCLLWNDKDLDYRKQRGATTPAALAKALTTLSAVSCGAIHSATFAGGPDCAWLAALAEWVLGLTVEVRDAETGQCLYRKMGGAQYDTPQVTVLRALNAQSSTLQLKDKTCFLPTGAEMFRDNADAVERIFAGGRSTWDSILADSLPAEPLQRLFSPEAAPSFSIILHNAFEGMKQEVADTRGFFDILPELKPILLHSRTEKQTVDEAVDILYELCSCSLCGRPTGSCNTCILRVVKTILEYIWILSHLHIHEKILPSPAGLRHLYSIYKSSYKNPILAARVMNRNRTYKSFIAGILHIMTGIPVLEEPSKDVSALSSSGISICCGSLLDPNSPPSESLFST